MAAQATITGSETLTDAAKHSIADRTLGAMAYKTAESRLPVQITRQLPVSKRVNLRIYSPAIRPTKENRGLKTHIEAAEKLRGQGENSW